MPAINFPDNPAINDEFTSNGRTWIYAGNSVWNTVETEAITGPIGPTGVVKSTTAPTNTDALWLDSDDEADPLAIPAGGTTSQVLTKNTNADYDTIWSNIYGLPSGGTTGQVLAKQSNSNYDVQWTIPGNMTQIASTDMSSGASTISFDSIPATYKDLRLIIKNANMSADGDIRMQVNSTAGIYYRNFPDERVDSVTSATIGLVVGHDVSDGNTICGHVEIYEYASDAIIKNAYGSINWSDTASANYDLWEQMYRIRTSSAISSISLTASAGTFTAGTATLWGIK